MVEMTLDTARALARMATATSRLAETSVAALFTLDHIAAPAELLATRRAKIMSTVGVAVGTTQQHVARGTSSLATQDARAAAVAFERGDLHMVKHSMDRISSIYRQIAGMP